MYFKKSLKLNLNGIIYSWVGREWVRSEEWERNVNRELINFLTWLNYTQSLGWKVNKFLSNTRIFLFFASDRNVKFPWKISFSTPFFDMMFPDEMIQCRLILEGCKASEIDTKNYLPAKTLSFDVFSTLVVFQNLF